MRCSRRGATWCLETRRSLGAGLVRWCGGPVNARDNVHGTRASYHCQRWLSIGHRHRPVQTPYFLRDFRGCVAGCNADAGPYGCCALAPLRLATSTARPLSALGKMLTSPSCAANPPKSPRCASIQSLNRVQSARASSSGSGTPSMRTPRRAVVAFMGPGCWLDWRQRTTRKCEGCGPR